MQERVARPLREVWEGSQKHRKRSNDGRDDADIDESLVVVGSRERLTGEWSEKSPGVALTGVDGYEGIADTNANGSFAQVASKLKAL